MGRIQDIQNASKEPKQPTESIREYLHRIGGETSLSESEIDQLAAAIEQDLFATSSTWSEWETELFHRFRQDLKRRTQTPAESTAKDHADNQFDETDTSKAGFSGSPTESTDQRRGDTPSDSSTPCAKGEPARPTPCDRADSPRHSPTLKPSRAAVDDFYWPSQSVLLVRALQFVPAVLLVSLLTLPIPSPPDPAREAAAYFQAEALLHTGLESFTYVTFQESDASIHLFSVLSAPLVEAGYVEGGRLISLSAAVCTTVLVAWVANRFWGRSASLLAPSLLWANPYFIRFSYGFIPEALSIALTLGAMATVLKFANTGQNRWYFVGLLLIVLGVFNHGWEAIIVLPFSVVVAYRREWSKVVGSWATAIGSVTFVKAITSLQEETGVNTTDFGIHNTGIDIFLTYDWWGRWLNPEYFSVQFITGPGRYSGPFYFAEKVSFVLAVVTVLFWLLRAGWTRRRTDVLMSTWAGIGVALLVLLPGGAVHLYYLWPAIVPTTLSAAYVGHVSYQYFAKVETTDTADTALQVSIAVLVLSSTLYVGLFETALFSPMEPRNETVPDYLDSGEVIEAGLEVRHYDVDGLSDVVLVGNWSQQYGGEYLWRGNRWQTIVRLFIYGGVDMRGLWDVETLSPRSETGPRYVTTPQEANDCEVMVIKTRDGQLETRPCTT